MKKVLKYVCLIAFTLLLIPNLVLAEELPREGVHYYLTYPNGEEYVTKSYDEATSQDERLIYSGLTNSEGQVILEDLSNEGTLRIVQKVPSGYTTDTAEVTLDLSNGKSPVDFVDIKGVNPNTGQSIIFICLVIAVLVVAATLLKKDSKNVFMFIIPMIIIGGFILQVKAANDNLVITIKDKAGNKLAGVEVEVYAKPIKVEYAPTITFDANGGYFLDGTDLMYFRLPSPSCSFEEFMSNLGSDFEMLAINYSFANRIGYERDYDNDEVPEVLTNDTVIKINWIKNDNAKYITIHGNGGYYDFFGKRLDTITIHEDYIDIIYGNIQFIKDDKTFDKYSTDTSCKNSIDEDNIPADIYACYKTRDDGIYVNDVLTSDDIYDCFNAYNVGENSASFYNYSRYLTIEGLNQDALSFKLNIMNPRSATSHIDFGMFNAQTAASEEINSIVVVKNDNDIITITSSDLELRDGVYYLTNASKKQALVDYLRSLYIDCDNSEQ